MCDKYITCNDGMSSVQNIPKCDFREGHIEEV